MLVTIDNSPPFRNKPNVPLATPSRSAVVRSGRPGVALPARPVPKNHRRTIRPGQSRAARRTLTTAKTMFAKICDNHVVSHLGDGGIALSRSASAPRPRRLPRAARDRDALEGGLLDDGCQNLLDHAARLEKGREMAASTRPSTARCCLPQDAVPGLAISAAFRNASEAAERGKDAPRSPGRPC